MQYFIILFCDQGSRDVLYVIVHQIIEGRLPGHYSIVLYTCTTVLCASVHGLSTVKIDRLNITKLNPDGTVTCLSDTVSLAINVIE